jgi:hypothetical protein
MKYFHFQQRDALDPYATLLTGGECNEQRLTVDALLAVEIRLPKPNSEGTGRDYSEEAIVERDPAYRLPEGTGCEEPTVEAVSAEVRRDLARRLHELGMSRARAAAVASL